MKRFTIILTVLMATIITTNAQWTVQTSGTNKGFNSVYFTDANTGYAVGGNNTPGPAIILKTSNGGTNWTEQTSGPTYYLNSVYFTDANTGYTVGSGGTILKTTNGGTNWTAQTSGTTNYLNSVYLTDANTGYTVGTNGIILKTTNGGTNWTAQTSGVTSELTSVFFPSATTGYAIGWNGTMLKTINGGTNWTSLTSGTTNPLFSVYFTDVNTGYIVGGTGISGAILKTTNGGTNWTAQTSGITDDIKSVYFIDANTGYAVSIGGSIIKTSNGGTNWTVQTCGTTKNLFSVYFTDSNTGYAVGSNGTILKTTNGGVGTIIEEIPNSGFESWSTDYNPVKWLANYTTASKSTDAYTGCYALKLQTTIQSGNNSGNGTINSLPPKGTEGAKPAFPISTRHTTLNGYYKFYPLWGDSCQFYVMLYKHGYVNPGHPEYGNLVGFGHQCESLSATYAPFTVHIYYFDGTTIPDSAWIALNAFKDYDFVTGTEKSPLGNSTLYVDNLTFDNTITSNPEYTAQNKLFILCPNPATDIVTLEINSSNNEDMKLNIYTITGVLVRSEMLKQNLRQINISDLNNGIYIVEIKSKKWSEKQKLIIQR